MLAEIFGVLDYHFTRLYSSFLSMRTQVYIVYIANKSEFYSDVDRDLPKWLYSKIALFHRIVYSTKGLVRNRFPFALFNSSSSSNISASDIHQFITMCTPH